MKTPLLLLLGGLLLIAPPRLQGQTTDDATADTPAPPGSTVITSNELHSDQLNHVSVFTGKVVVTGTNFRMTCEEMTVNFTKDNKVNTIVATGNVIITQPNRVTQCGHAEYFRDEDKFVLTDQPTILDGKTHAHGPQIVIYRSSQKMEIGGGRTEIILGPGAMDSDKTTPSGAETK